MWRRRLAFMLIAVTVYAQDEAAVGQKPRPPRILAGVQTHHVALRQGKSDKVRIVTSLGGFVTLPANPVPGITPLRLELESTDGLAFEAMRYPKARLKHLKFSQQPVPVTWGTGMVLETKVHVDRGAALGEHTINGKLVYQLMDNNGIQDVREVPVTANVKVVTRGERVAIDNRWPRGLSTGQIILIIVLFPILLPIALICTVAFGGCD